MTGLVATDAVAPAAARVTTPSRLRFAIVLVMLLSICRGVVWTVATPPWEAPDEPSHATYAEHLSLHPGPFVGPVRTSIALQQSIVYSQLGEISHNPLYPGALSSAELDTRASEIQHIHRADEGLSSGFVASAGGYPPTFYYLGAVTLRAVQAMGGSYLVGIQALRLLCVLLAAVALWFQIGILRELLGSGVRLVCGAAIIALMPMYGYVFASFNPDVLVAVLFSAAIYASLRIERRGLSSRRMGALLAVTALALLTKPTAIALVPLVVWIAFRAARLRQRTWRLPLVAGGVAGVVVGAPYFIFTRLDSSAGIASGIASQGGRTIGLAAVGHYVVVFRRAFMTLYHSSFWGNYGWLDASFLPSMYYYFFVLALLALIGLLVRVFRRRCVPARWIVALIPAVTLGLILVGIEFVLVTSAGTGGLFIQGRYLFPVMGVLVAAYLSGITALARTTWFSRAVSIGSVALMLVFHLASWVLLVLPRYTL
jgi:4-amino-4-deoxy-L-arabinose transferase-like glycosyltransferase